MAVQKNNPICLILEGNIGAGKSTFLKIIENNFDVEVVYEPHEQWQNVAGENLLDKFYKDTSRWSYSFQTYAFVTRVVQQEQYAQTSSYPVHILERSVYSDRYCFAKNCYEMGVMSALEWKLYQEWFEWLVYNYTQKPHGFIYLKTDPEVCYQRLLKRNRSEESTVDLEYLKMLHEKHENWLIKKKNVASYLKNVPVLELECNKDFQHDVVQQQKHLDTIERFLMSFYPVKKEKDSAILKTNVHPS